MINRWNAVARFALMHSMATSLFFWFMAVRNETVDSLHHRQLLPNEQERQHWLPDATHREGNSLAMPYLMSLAVGDRGVVGKYYRSTEDPPTRPSYNFTEENRLFTFRKFIFPRKRE